MRLLLLSFLAIALSGCVSLKRDRERPLVIENIKPRFMVEQDFMRVSEYWSGKEHKGRRVILRSDPDERTGYYFTLVLNERVRELPRGASIVGEFYTAKSLEVQTFEFDLPNRPPKTKEIFVGLTGEDWPVDTRTAPGAWRFTIQDVNGNALASKQSYLWEL